MVVHVGNGQTIRVNFFRLVRRLTLFSILIISYLLLSYNYFSGWWNAALGTAAIVLMSYFIWNKDFTGHTGLSMNPVTILKSLVAAAIFTLTALFIMKYIANRQNILIEYTNWKSYFHTIFYVMNEEIVVGAIPLMVMIKKWKMKPVLASIALAVLFSIIHFIFYKWIFYERGIIQFSTLTTLFLIGIVRNNLIIQTEHIGYSWALHFSWMAVMFGSSHEFLPDNSPLSEPVRFNTYLGSYEMLIISTLLVGLSLFYMIKKGKSQIISDGNW
jgi:hypothetical protein